jgi:hypothetical protein
MKTLGRPSLRSSTQFLVACFTASCLGTGAAETPAAAPKPPTPAGATGIEDLLIQEPAGSSFFSAARLTPRDWR